MTFVILEDGSGSCEMEDGSGGVLLEAVVGGLYGPGIAMDSRANWRLNGPEDSTQKYSYRFRAAATSTLTKVHYLLAYAWTVGNTGYGKGDGGQVTETIQTDDGSGNPSGTILATYVYTAGYCGPSPQPAGGEYQHHTLASPPSLTKGTLYHLVFAATAADPVNNYISINNCWVNDPQTPRQPKFPDMDWALLRYTATDGWSANANAYNSQMTPIAAFEYSDGTVQGNGYEIVGYAESETVAIAANSKISQYLTVSGTSRTVTAFTTRLEQTALSAGALTVRLETLGGTEIETGTIPAASVPVDGSDWYGQRWATYTFATPRTLALGSSYRVILSAPAGSNYQAYPMRRAFTTGTPGTYFPDGRAQYSIDGTTWLDFSLPNSDLQFYFTTAG
jgi:hypothetical protein